MQRNRKHIATTKLNKNAEKKSKKRERVEDAVIAKQYAVEVHKRHHVVEDARKPIIVNPNRLTQNTSQILVSLLKNHPEEVSFSKNSSDDYVLLAPDPTQPEHTIEHPVCLSQLLVQYVRKKNPHERRYALCQNELLGSGHEGQVFVSDFTISLVEVEGVLKIKCKQKLPEKRRVVKNLLPADYDSRSPNIKAQREQSFLTQFPDSGVKNPILTRDDSQAFLVMRCAEGKEFSKYLNVERLTGLFTFTIDQRIDLSIMIAEAIKAMHEKEIIHRDIKPENMILEIDSENNPIKITIIDFGFSLWKHEWSKRISGTRKYIPLEAFYNPFYLPQQRDDVYAFAVILRKDLWKLCLKNTNFDELSYEHTNAISKLITNGIGSSWMPCGRATLDDMIATFKAIKAERIENQYAAAMLEAYKGQDCHQDEDACASSSYPYRMF